MRCIGVCSKQQFCQLRLARVKSIASNHFDHYIFWLTSNEYSSKFADILLELIFRDSQNFVFGIGLVKVLALLTLIPIFFVLCRIGYLFLCEFIYSDLQFLCIHVISSFDNATILSIKLTKPSNSFLEKVIYLSSSTLFTLDESLGRFFKGWWLFSIALSTIGFTVLSQEK